MILLYTDFGWCGPYVGLMHRVVAGRVPSVPVVDLMHDAPRFRPVEAGRLLAALLPGLPRRCIVVGVIDPGVGTERSALVCRRGEQWLIGPDNGLFAAALVGEDGARAWRLPVPGEASASFHGRDVFAPAAASLAVGRMPAGLRPVREWVGRGESRERDVAIYIDDFGNVMIGRNVAALTAGEAPRPGGRELPRARTFAECAPGAAFWYENSLGLVEIAVNQGDAARELGLAVGDPVPMRAELET
ncbi:SAM hydrolase/SAM-dependent halogenase family protein [Arhodomonas sp. SL1]|uniref:SAM hydrolase/SAM-dependent halogenase family protein n=1 Tax=Arhodomonas sp. SL1 TaxID=3425691 RepID=UPI003F880750